MSAARILLVGFGNMGQALVRGWLAHGRSRDAIRVVDPGAAALSAARELEVEASAELEQAAAQPVDVVVLAVKPDQLESALPPYRRLGEAGAVFLSIVAGKPLAVYARLLGAVPVVRAMPNTPAAIGRGMTALCPNEHVSGAQRALCEELMSAVGAVVSIADERHMDAVTAVSGSGPAYVFLLIEALRDAGIDAGLPPDVAGQLALTTVAGAGAYAAAAGEDAAELRRRVTSPGGTTQAALEVLMAKGGLAELLAEAVRAAAERSRRLSRD